MLSAKKINIRNLLVLQTQFTRLHSTGKNVNFIKKILIANRGEIACRVIRTAQKLGIETVAVYSDVDSQSLHVKLSDEAYRIGPAASQESYLRQDKIIDAALKCGANAIHPGYGFLSENAEFAELCQKNGLIFIGPPASAIRDMGIKSTAKAIMSSAGVPIIDGYFGENQTTTYLKQEAQRIGYPVMIKAVRGGGGKGMRIVTSENEFDTQLESAKREALKSFGDDVVLIEKFIDIPRHVEVQVFGDQHNNYVYLFERDCSVQRRHQKIIEEAPGPGISNEVRQRLGQAAVKAAKAVYYVGAGTVEFIMDRNHNFYFMEMNTRLQVEHPVTEMITNTDLVEWQIRVAAGEPLPKLQNDICLNGHAFEARIYAENPRENFMPGAGVLDHLSAPAPASNVRIETGVLEGDEVSVHYDPMIAKLVVWGSDRVSALQKLTSCLSQYNIVGLNTNVTFLTDLASHPEFQAGHVHTDFIKEHQDSLFIDRPITDHILCQAAFAVSQKVMLQEKDARRTSADLYSPFFLADAFRLNGNATRQLSLQDGSNKFELLMKYLDSDKFTTKVNSNLYHVTGKLTNANNGWQLDCYVNDCYQKSHVVFYKDSIVIFDKNGTYELTIPTDKFMSSKADSSSVGSALAPMPGVIEKVLIKEGMEVKQGDPLIIMIAMKMEYVIKASKTGIIEKVYFKVGDNVGKNSVLIKFQGE